MKDIDIYNPENVASYYDEWTEKYLSTTGELIQAYRPKTDRELIDYCIGVAQLKEGQKIIDAGCGTATLSVAFAQHEQVFVEALTISEVQATIALAKVKACGLQNQVRVQKGDYHLLDKYYPAAAYDSVLFVESLGHSQTPEKAIEAAYKVLKKAGAIYIKDFFKRVSNDTQTQAAIDRVVQNINQLYAYSTLDLNKVLTSLRENNFKIDYIRRPLFELDISARLNFESKYGIDIFGGEPEFAAAEWLEIRCCKDSL